MGQKVRSIGHACIRTEKETVRQTSRHTYRLAHTQKDRQTCIYMYRHIYTYTQTDRL